MTATARVLAQRGLVGTTTNHIARVAGVSIGTLYQYFPNKDEVLRALLARERRRAQDAVRRALRDHAGAPLEQVIREVIGAALNAALVTGDVHMALHHEAAAKVGDDRGGTDGRSIIERDLAAFLEQRRPDLHVKDAKLAAFTIVQSIHALVHEVLAAQRSEPAAMLIDEGTDLVLGYLRRKSLVGRR